MNTVCMKNGSCPEIKLFIPAGNYNSPQHLVEQIQIAIEEKCGAILRQIHSMITLSYKKSGNRVNLHVETYMLKIQKESKLDFQSLLEKYLD